MVLRFVENGRIVDHHCLIHFHKLIKWIHLITYNKSICLYVDCYFKCFFLFKWETWLITFFFLPVTASKWVPYWALFCQTWIKMESYVTIIIFSTTKVHSKSTNRQQIACITDNRNNGIKTLIEAKQIYCASVKYMSFSVWIYPKSNYQMHFALNILQSYIILKSQCLLQMMPNDYCSIKSHIVNAYKY